MSSGVKRMLEKAAAEYEDGNRKAAYAQYLAVLSSLMYKLSGSRISFDVAGPVAKSADLLEAFELAHECLYSAENVILDRPSDWRPAHDHPPPSSLPHMAMGTMHPPSSASPGTSGPTNLSDPIGMTHPSSSTSSHPSVPHSSSSSSPSNALYQLIPMVQPLPDSFLSASQVDDATSTLPRIPLSPLTRMYILYTRRLAKMQRSLLSSSSSSSSSPLTPSSAAAAASSLSPKHATSTEASSALRRAEEDVRVQRAKVAEVQAQTTAATLRTLGFWDADALAKCWCAISASIYSQIHVRQELRPSLTLSPSSKDMRVFGPGVEALIDLERYITASTVHCLLTSLASSSGSDQVKSSRIPSPNPMTLLIIRAAHRAKSLYRDYNTHAALVKALASAPLTRLPAVWAGVPRKVCNRVRVWASELDILPAQGSSGGGTAGGISIHRYTLALSSTLSNVQDALKASGDHSSSSSSSSSSMPIAPPPMSPTASDASNGPSSSTILAIPWMRAHAALSRSIHQTHGASRESGNRLNPQGYRILESTLALLEAAQGLSPSSPSSSLRDILGESSLTPSPASSRIPLGKRAPFTDVEIAPSSHHPTLTTPSLTTMTIWPPASLLHIPEPDLSLHHWLLSRPFLTRDQLWEESHTLIPAQEGQSHSCPKDDRAYFEPFHRLFPPMHDADEVEGRGRPELGKDEAARVIGESWAGTGGGIHGDGVESSSSFSSSFSSSSSSSMTTASFGDQSRGQALRRKSTASVLLGGGGSGHRTGRSSMSTTEILAILDADLLPSSTNSASSSMVSPSLLGSSLSRTPSPGALYLRRGTSPLTHAEGEALEERARQEMMRSLGPEWSGMKDELERLKDRPRRKSEGWILSDARSRHRGHTMADPLERSMVNSAMTAEFLELSRRGRSMTGEGTGPSHSPGSGIKEARDRGAGVKEEGKGDGFMNVPVGDKRVNGVTRQEDGVTTVITTPSSPLPRPSSTPAISKGLVHGGVMGSPLLRSVCHPGSSTSTGPIPSQGHTTVSAPSSPPPSPVKIIAPTSSSSSTISSSSTNTSSSSSPSSSSSSSPSTSIYSPSPYFRRPIHSQGGSPLVSPIIPTDDEGSSSADSSHESASDDKEGKDEGRKGKDASGKSEHNLERKASTPQLSLSLPSAGLDSAFPHIWLAPPMAKVPDATKEEEENDDEEEERGGKEVEEEGEEGEEGEGRSVGRRGRGGTLRRMKSSPSPLRRPKKTKHRRQGSLGTPSSPFNPGSLAAELLASSGNSSPALSVQSTDPSDATSGYGGNFGKERTSHDVSEGLEGELRKLVQLQQDALAHAVKGKVGEEIEREERELQRLKGLVLEAVKASNPTDSEERAKAEAEKERKREEERKAFEERIRHLEEEVQRKEEERLRKHQETSDAGDEDEIHLDMAQLIAAQSEKARREEEEEEEEDESMLGESESTLATPSNTLGEEVTMAELIKHSRPEISEVEDEDDLEDEDEDEEEGDKGHLQRSKRVSLLPFYSSQGEETGTEHSGFLTSGLSGDEEEEESDMEDVNTDDERALMEAAEEEEEALWDRLGEPPSDEDDLMTNTSREHGTEDEMMMSEDERTEDESSESDTETEPDSDTERESESEEEEVQLASLMKAQASLVKETKAEGMVPHSVPPIISVVGEEEGEEVGRGNVSTEGNSGGSEYWSAKPFEQEGGDEGSGSGRSKGRRDNNGSSDQEGGLVSRSLSGGTLIRPGTDREAKDGGDNFLHVPEPNRRSGGRRKGAGGGKGRRRRSSKSNQQQNHHSSKEQYSSTSAIAVGSGGSAG
ncbi:MAG: hypothetical protein DHS80DRAFT_23357 [Piptocephalis tieghemiana]|nr:MAG: hypothetical protein DHS80DRAFT_23357 [Piptocephalis tieghemiana]